jgi:hypothetical protein
MTLAALCTAGESVNRQAHSRASWRVLSPGAINPTAPDAYEGMGLIRRRSGKTSRAYAGYSNRRETLNTRGDDIGRPVHGCSVGMDA